MNLYLKYTSTDILDLLIKQLNPLKTNGEIIKGNYQNFLRFDFIKKCNGKSLAHFDFRVALILTKVHFNR